MTAMKAYTSRERFDESRRFVAVHEEMGRYRLDADANEQARLQLTDARRRSADLAEGSPDDGFAIAETFVLDAITGTAGWTGSGLEPGDLRAIAPELRLERRDPDTLPHVVRVRGHHTVQRLLPTPLDLLAVPEPPVPGAPVAAGPAWAVAELQVRLRLDRRTNDDDAGAVRLIVRDVDGAWHEVLELPPTHRDGVLRIGTGALAPLQRGSGPGRTLTLTGWGFSHLPVRAATDVDALLGVDAALGADLVVRGGGGTPGTAGRLFTQGHRAFIESDWRYSRQPYLPRPAALPDPADGETVRYVLDLGLLEREVHDWQDRDHIAEPALGDPSTFRRQQVVQVHARLLPELEPGQAPPDPVNPDPARLPGPPAPLSQGRLSSAVPAGSLPERTPPEEPDRCRERCLFTEQISTGEGYLGTGNANVRIEVVGVAGSTRRAVVWSRDNASLVAPLVADLPADGVIISLDPFQAARFRAGDVVTLEDDAARLDGEDPRHHPVLRRLRSVDTATGRLELEPAGHTLATDPEPLAGGGGPGRALTTAGLAAVRRWDGADWLITGLRYRLVDNITFAFSGDGHRPTEHWLFTARVVAPDGAATGVVERRVDAAPDGPYRVRQPLALVTATRTGATVQRTVADLRERFLPLREVRQRLIELGARQLAPGAFTVVVGDGERTFGHIDQNLAEGVTGDEALHAAIAELDGRPGTIYLRAGTYVLEHPVVLQGLSGVRILGDGAATRLEVRGAGGAFVLDDCGASAPVGLELMDLVEQPEAEVPIGAPLDGDPAQGLPADDGGGSFGPQDVLHPAAGLPALLDGLRDRLAGLEPGAGRASASLVATVMRLRALQRANPGQTLETVAPELLATLRALPHGVVTVGDSRLVRLESLRLISTERAVPTGTFGAGVLLTGTLRDVTVSGCTVRACAGVVAVPLGAYLAPAALVLRPRSGLFVQGLRIIGSDLAAAVPPGGAAGVGVLLRDGALDGVTVRDNDLSGWTTGVLVRDRAEARAGTGQPDGAGRTAVQDNRIAAVTGIGVDVEADGVDVDRNEIRLAVEAADVRAGVRVAGSQLRVTGCSVELPVTAAGASPLALEAGVIVGSGVDDGGTLARVVSDVELVDVRVAGAGAQTLGHGVVIGGAGPVHGVTLSRCTVRRVGGSGLRAWGYAGAVGGLRVLDCTVEEVASASVTWGRAVPDAVAELVPGVVGTDPQQLLAALLAAPAGRVRPALDGVLRWLEQATLRTGLGLGLVDDAELARNRVRGVGRAGLDDTVPGVDVHVAGIALLGGDDHRVEGNDIAEVYGVVHRVPVVLPPTRVRPGVLETLRALPGATSGASSDLYGAVTGLRTLAHAYALAAGREREAVGRRSYTAMEAVGTALRDRGGQAARLGDRLLDSLEEMRDAQGAAAHTAAANLVRVAASQAAQLMAADDRVAETWGYAVRVDAATVSGTGSDLSAAAVDVADAAAGLLEGLGLQIDLAGQARAVVAAEDAARPAAALTLAGTLGEVAAARAAAVRAGGTGPLGPEQTRLLSTVLGAVGAAVGEPGSGDLTAAAVAGLADGIASLVGVLEGPNPGLAATVRQRYERLRRGQGRPPAADVEALRDAVQQARAFLADPTRVTNADGAAEQDAAHGQLVLLTADWIDRRLAGLGEGDEATETRSLRLLSGSVGQLGRLVGSHPLLAPRVEQVRAAVRAAAEQPGDRARHKADAARALADLRSGQAEVAGVPEATAADDAPAPAAERLAGLGQLLLNLRDDAPADERVDAAAGFTEQLRLGLTGDVSASEGDRRRLLAEATAVQAALAAPGGGAARARAVHRAAVALAETAAIAGEQVGSPATQAVAAMLAVLPDAVDPEATDAEAVGSARGLLASLADRLSPSTVGVLTAAPDRPGLLGSLHGQLGAVSGVPLTRPIVLPPTELVDPRPADGVLAVAVDVSLTLVGNRVRAGRRGLAVGEAGTHPLAPLPVAGDPGGGETGVVGNTVRAVAEAGIVVALTRPGRIRVEGNDVQGCCGAATAAAATRAAIEVRAVGQASVRDNRLDGNGSTTHPGVVHGLCVVVPGDVTVTGNWVRHAGGQRGGAGLMVLAVPIPAESVPGRSWDLAALASEPFLDVDAPPRPPRPPWWRLPVVNPAVVGLLGPSVLQSAATGVASTTPVGGRAGVSGGSLSAGLAATTLAAVRPPALALLTVPPAAPPSPVVADLMASRWLDPAIAPVTASTGTRLRPVVDFLRRVPVMPLPLPVPPPRPARTLQVSGNDVVARGAALVALGSGAVLLGITVSANTLVSTGTGGAVYLRDVDSCTIGGNRVESPAAVTVMVVRALDSLVSVTGNVLAGQEPPLSPSLPPVVRPPLVLDPAPGRTPPVLGRPPIRLDLDLPAAMGGRVSVPLDAGKVLAALRGHTDLTSSAAAEKAAATFTDFAVSNQIALNPKAAFVLETAAQNGLLEVDLTREVAVKPALERLRGRSVELGDVLGSRPIATRAAAAAAAAAAPAPDAPNTPGTADPGTDLSIQLTRLTEDYGRILTDTGLSPAAKLYGLATSSGVPDGVAKALVQEHLTRNSGDADAALRSGLASITGVSAAAPVVPATPDGVPVLESVLGAVLAAGALDLQPSDPGAFTGRGAIAGGIKGGIGRPTRPIPPIVQRPPDPALPPVPAPPTASHSLVVIGGAQVAVAGNASTAGADVRPAGG